MTAVNDKVRKAVTGLLTLRKLLKEAREGVEKLETAVDKSEVELASVIKAIDPPRVLYGQWQFHVKENGRLESTYFQGLVVEEAETETETEAADDCEDEDDVWEDD